VLSESKAGIIGRGSPGQSRFRLQKGGGDNKIRITKKLIYSSYIEEKRLRGRGEKKKILPRSRGGRDNYL